MVAFRQKISYSPAPGTHRPHQPQPQMDDIPYLLEIMATKTGGQLSAAVNHIYKLGDVGHKENRVPMVCSGKYNVLEPLAAVLLANEQTGDARHLACLALNNLCIPKENKRVMALGPSSSILLRALCKVMASGEKEAYLCSICLMNLSFLEDNLVRILHYCPVPDGSMIHAPPLDCPESMICVLERTLRCADPPAQQQEIVPTNISLFGRIFRSRSDPKSIQLVHKSEKMRWTCGLIKNLATSEENASLFGNTRISAHVVDNLRKSESPSSEWGTNSLEDFSLWIILNLAQWPASRIRLIEAGTVDVIKHISVDKNVHGLKASMALALLKARLSDYPDGGIHAFRSISELITNISEEKGKDGHYVNGGKSKVDNPHLELLLSHVLFIDCFVSLQDGNGEGCT